MAPLLCVTYPDVEPLPRIEEEISMFADSLPRVCDSITRCELEIGRSPDRRSGGCLWTVRATLHVFGESIQVVCFRPDVPHGNPLRRALRDVLVQATTELAAVARDHVGCCCCAKETSVAQRTRRLPAEC